MLYKFAHNRYFFLILFIPDLKKSGGGLAEMPPSIGNEGRSGEDLQEKDTSHEITELC